MVSYPALNWTFGIEMLESNLQAINQLTLNWTFGIEMYFNGYLHKNFHDSELDLWN